MGAVALCTRGSEVAVGGGGRGESIPPHPCADWGTLRRSDLRKPPRNESREVAPLTLGTPTSTPPPPRAGSSGLVVSSDPCAPALKGSLGVSRVARQSASALLAPPPPRDGGGWWRPSEVRPLATRWGPGIGLESRVARQSASSLLAPPPPRDGGGWWRPGEVRPRRDTMGEPGGEYGVVAPSGERALV